MIPIKCMAATGPMLRGIGPRSMPTGICGRPAEQWFLMQDSGFADVLLCVIGYNEHAIQINAAELEFLQKLTREEAEAWQVAQEIHNS